MQKKPVIDKKFVVLPMCHKEEYDYDSWRTKREHAVVT
jgi:hypothetical protein